MAHKKNNSRLKSDSRVFTPKGGPTGRTQYLNPFLTPFESNGFPGREAFLMGLKRQFITFAEGLS